MMTTLIAEGQYICRAMINYFCKNSKIRVVFDFQNAYSPDKCKRSPEAATKKRGEV